MVMRCIVLKYRKLIDIIIFYEFMKADKALTFLLLFVRFFSVNLACKQQGRMCGTLVY